MWWELARKKWPQNNPNQGQPELNKKLDENEVALTFVNHATFLIQLPGLNILTDPVWCDRASPFQWVGPKRVRKPGVPLAELPKIDVIMVSHNHYDHLDVQTLKTLNSKFQPQIVVAAGDRGTMENLKYREIHEMDWWETSAPHPELKVTFLPTQHFSARGLFDRNKSLWGSYLLEFRGFKIYFGGDAAYSSHYKEIGKRIGRIDIALIGIGAYHPQWFMRNLHMSPREGVQAHLDLTTKLSVGMHFGTFQMSSEAIDQPIVDLEKAKLEMGLEDSEFIVLKEGETRLFTKNN